MNSIKENYVKDLEKELKLFLFLCGERDKKIFLSMHKYKDMNEIVRLACISMVFNYRKIMLKIVATIEKNMDDFMRSLDYVNNNFSKIDEWVTEFIGNIEVPEAQELAREFWQERRTAFDGENFNLGKLLRV